MNPFFIKIKKTLFSGIVLFLPLVVLVMIFQKIYSFLFGFGHKLNGILGLGKEFSPILTILILIAVLFIFGLLVKFTGIEKVEVWVENNILVFIPTYSKYKAKMMAKLHPGKDLGQPALIEMQDGLKPGFVVSSESGKSTVFLPSTPDSDYGEVWIVDSKRVTEVNMNLKEFKTSLLLAGKGLKI